MDSTGCRPDSAAKRKIPPPHADTVSIHLKNPLVGSVVQNEVLYTVIPAKAGIQGRIMCGQVCDARFRGHDTCVCTQQNRPSF